MLIDPKKKTTTLIGSSPALCPKKQGGDFDFTDTMLTRNIVDGPTRILVLLQPTGDLAFGFKHLMPPFEQKLQHINLIAGKKIHYPVEKAGIWDCIKSYHTTST